MTYFFEKGLNILKDKGIFAFICSNKFAKADYGEKL
ncbi:Eco57I restriction-modification methylase domain-containing protein, partial [uncultured Methanobrevibacter sp.]